MTTPRKESIPKEELTKLISNSILVSDRYERDKITPIIDVVESISNLLNTMIGYLLVERVTANLFKGLVLLQRLTKRNKMKNTEKIH